MSALVRFLRRLGLPVAIAALTAGPAIAQPAVTTLFSFSNDGSGEHPWAAPVLGSDGALYGTTYLGGANNAGTVYRLSRSRPDRPWKRTVLASLGAGRGAGPLSGVVEAPDGSLYGATESGGGGECSGGCGVVYRLAPAAGGRYDFEVIYRFRKVRDGVRSASRLAIDADGVLYGTTVAGGASDMGTVFTISRVADTWKKTTIHSFTGGGGDGQFPQSGVVFGPDGALYGTTLLGGDPTAPKGTVYRLEKRPGGGWRFELIFRLKGGVDGERPVGPVAFDKDGALYGTTPEGGAAPCFAGCGTVFRIAPSRDGSRWVGGVIHRFSQGGGAAPRAELAVDRAGAVWGMTPNGGGGPAVGVIFRLRPPVEGRTKWRPSVVYRFTGLGADGAVPFGGLFRDADSGAFYGATRDGGNGGGSSGTVFKLDP